MILSWVWPDTKLSCFFHFLEKAMVIDETVSFIISHKIGQKLKHDFEIFFLKIKKNLLMTLIEIVLHSIFIKF